MAEEEYISVGKITGVHGLHGNLKVYLYSESVDVFESARQIQIKSPNGGLNSYTVKTAKPYKKGMLLTLKECVDINVAEKLVGSKICIARDSLAELDEDEYYWFEIIGLDVFLVDGDYLGKVHSIFPTGSNDVYVVKKSGRETLIPALESVILSIDLEKKKMTVDLPEGL